MQDNTMAEAEKIGGDGAVGKGECAVRLYRGWNCARISCVTCCGLLPEVLIWVNRA